MKIERVICIILSLLMIVGILSACNSKEAAKSIPTLKWYVPGDSQSDIASVMAEANKITKNKVGANIDIQFIDTSSFNQRMQMTMASNANYDLCFTGYLNKYVTAVYNESLAQLTQLIDKNAPKLWDALPQYLWDDAKINGEIYAVPNQQVEFYQYAMLVQKDLAEKYGLDVNSIKRHKDLEPFLEKIKQNEPEIYPYRANYQLQMFWKPVFEEITPGYGIRIENPKKVVVLRKQPEYMEGIDLLRSWYKKGYIRANVLSAGDDSSELFAGKFAVYDGTWKPGYEAQLLTTNGEEYVPIKIGKPYMTNGNSRTTMTGISYNSKNKEECIKLIELLNTDKDFYNLICFGIEGKHYKLDNNDKVEYIENSGYAPKAAWKFGNQFLAFNIKGEDRNTWEETQKMNDECEKSPIIGFYFDTSTSNNIISHLSAITGEYRLINYGAIDKSSCWDEMESRIKVAGEDDLIKDIQIQLDTFWEKNK